MANSNALRPSLGRLLRPLGTETRPALLSSSVPTKAASASAPFSTTTSQCKRKTRDSNRLRGVSALRRTGPREPLSVSLEELPRPANYKPEIKVDEDHGLWGFFPAKGKLMNKPADDEARGRAWKVHELRQKSWDDLHALWWACCRERNRISTANAERVRAKMGFGEFEANARDEDVRTICDSVPCFFMLFSSPRLPWRGNRVRETDRN